VIFSANTKEIIWNHVLIELKIRTEARTKKYLGLPVCVGRSRAKTFEYLKYRVWKERMLSKSRKHILIKACAQAIPTFAMSCFDSPTLCDEMSMVICRYWWAQQDKENKAYWLSWDTLSKPKCEGRLGFRGLYGFSLAMLARQGWQVLTNPESLCVHIS
jgi:hypothetical protein